MIEFLLPAILAGVGIAIVTGPLGAFVVWRRMAYFGDTLAHSALLGVALGLFLEINLTLAIIGSSVGLAVLLVSMQRQQSLANDSLLGILSHTSLAAGLVCVSLFGDARLDLFAFLFGDLLTSGFDDVFTIYIITLGVLALLMVLWRPLLSATIDENLARVEGVPVGQLRLVLMIAIAIVVAFAMKVVGILLITALLIVPAATSRRLTNSPEAMAIGASCIGVISVLAGILCSYQFDTPAGPSIVLSASFLFGLSWLKPLKTDS